MLNHKPHDPLICQIYPEFLLTRSSEKKALLREIEGSILMNAPYRLWLFISDWLHMLVHQI